MTEPLDATKADPFAGAPTFSMSNRLHRAIFTAVWALAASWTPPFARAWRLWILRCFGANLASTANVYSSVKIWLPKNLTMGSYSSLGPGVQVYSMAPIRIGQHVVVSQRSHLCCGTHDISNAEFQLRTAPIEIGDDAWICAEAFVGPGVTLGEGAVLAARGATFGNLSPWTVYRGNPAIAIKQRVHFERART